MGSSIAGPAAVVKQLLLHVHSQHQSSTYLLVSAFIHLLIHSPMHARTHVFVHLVVHSFVHERITQVFQLC